MSQENKENNNITPQKFIADAIEALSVLTTELKAWAETVEDQRLKDFLEKAAKVAETLKERAKKALQNTYTPRTNTWRRNTGTWRGSTWRRRRRNWQ